MLFNSYSFLWFFLIFFILYWSSARVRRLQTLLVLLGSYVFYGAWDERFLILIMVSTTTDYLTGFGASGGRLDRRMLIKSLGFLSLGSLFIVLHAGLEASWILYWLAAYIGVGSLVVYLVEAHAGERRRRKAYVALSVAVNLGILGVFKYFNFFSESLRDLAALMGVSIGTTSLAIVLPVGISFYTFQTMSYTLDAYGGRVKARKAFLEVAAYVAFFPQLVAGPIERAAHLLPQFFSRRSVTARDLSSALMLFIWGLFKKVVIADNLALIADPVFADPGSASGGALVAGLLAFTFQIYCDFSGYSDMARALARSLGFEIVVNFRLPYWARTPSEFWQRWHISLSSWLRDYLYIPLGGNRKGDWQTYRNLSITMLLGGLWHGANWNFVLWGGYQGLLLALYRILRVDAKLSNWERSAAGRFLVSITLWPTMFILVVYGWLLFRAQSFEIIREYTLGIFQFSVLDFSELWKVFLLILPLVIIQAFQHRMQDLEIFHRLPTFVRFNVVLFVSFGLLFLSAGGGQEFIYFDF